MLESLPFSPCSSGIQPAILSFSLDVPASIFLRIVDKEGSRLTDVADGCLDGFDLRCRKVLVTDKLNKVTREARKERWLARDTL